MNKYKDISRSHFPALILSTRLDLGETAPKFAKRFDVTRLTVWRWETGVSEAPYPVLEFCLRKLTGKRGWWK